MGFSEGTQSTPFDRGSDRYLKSAIFTDGPDLGTIADWLSGSRCVLDAGAGTLHAGGYLAENGIPRVVALDPSRAMLREGLDSYTGVAPIVGSAETLPFAPKVFDGLVCRYAAHHFANPEDFFHGARRVLEPGADLVFQDLVIEANDGLGELINEIAELRDPSHEAYRTPETWEQLLTEAGFDVKDAEKFSLSLTYRDWVDRSDPPRENREEIRRLLGTLSEEDRRRIGFVESDGMPQEFEYPVAMLKAIAPD